MAGLSSAVAEAALDAMLSDDRLAKTAETIENDIEGNVNYVSSLSEPLRQYIGAQFVQSNYREFRSQVVCASTSCAAFLPSGSSIV